MHAGNSWSHRFSLLFVIILIAVMGWYVYVGIYQILPKNNGDKTELSTLIGRERKGFPMPYPDRILSGNFQKWMEEAAQENFPFWDKLLPWYGETSRILSRYALAIFPKNWISLYPVWGHTVALIQNGERIVYPPRYYLQSGREKLRMRAEYYNKLAAEHFHVRFYVFAILLSQDWIALSDICISPVADKLKGDKYVREFRSFLHPTIGFSMAGENLSMQEATSLYYRTDHHLNMTGAYHIYRQIHRLFHEKNPAVGIAFKPKKWILLRDIMFYGSLARQAGAYDSISDVLFDGDFRTPSFKITISSTSAIARNKKELYYKGIYPKGKFTNHYGEYFGRDYGLIEYISEKPGHDNLLVIGDSFDNCLEPLLAGHFHHSYFVDIRHYAGQVGEDFNLAAFIQKHRITDVLFLGGEGLILDLSSLNENE